MVSFIRRSLMGKVVFFFVLVAALSCALVGSLSFLSARGALEQFTASQIEADVKASSTQVLGYLHSTLTDVRLLGENWSVKTAFEILSFYTQGAKAAQHEHVIDLGSKEYKKIVAEVGPVFTMMLQQHEEEAYQDLLMIVGAERAFVAYTQKGQADLGQTLLTGDLKGNDLAKLWMKVKDTRKPGMTDIFDYRPGGGPAAFVGVPILAAEGNFLGMLALRMGSQRLNLLMENTAQRWKSCSACLVGPDLLVRGGAKLTAQNVLKEKVENEITKQAIEGKDGTRALVDQRGVPVLYSWRPVGLKDRDALGADFDWALVAQMDATEAMEPVHALGYRIAIIAVAIAIIVAVMGWLLARTIARPAAVLAGCAEEISKGNLTLEVPVENRQDEIGVLAKSFHHMLRSLRDQIRLTQEGMNVLRAVVAEISETASRLALTIENVTSAVSETSATIEQVKQAARISSEKARHVAQTSQKAVEVSDAGRIATQDTIDKINFIRDQMESIGETVVRLSEHSRTVEDIIGAAQDLADQSNLLAVNASIEAARAGDQGRGFAVVAQEIKSLADQSKQATLQIRSILDETRKWVGAVVTTTEQGSKAVDAGLRQSILAGESIERLSATVEESAQVASVIDASSEQQLVGVEQTAQATVNIEEAMRESLESTVRLESASRKLEELGEQLQALVEQYKI